MWLGAFVSQSCFASFRSIPVHVRVSFADAAFERGCSLSALLYLLPCAHASQAMAFPPFFAGCVAAVIAYDPTVLDDYKPHCTHVTSKVLDTKLGLAGFIASQGYLALTILFTAVSSFFSGIRSASLVVTG